MKLKYFLSTLIVGLSFIGCATNSNKIEKPKENIFIPANITEIQIQTPHWKYKHKILFTTDKFNGLVFKNIPEVNMTNIANIALYPTGYAKLNIIKTKNMFKSHIQYRSLQPYVNQKLSPLYPKTIVYNIITGHPIFNGINKQYSEDGLKQSIFGKHMDIIYRADEKSSYFNDRAQHIIIKVKHLN